MSRCFFCYYYDVFYHHMLVTRFVTLGVNSGVIVISNKLYVMLTFIASGQWRWCQHGYAWELFVQYTVISTCACNRVTAPNAFCSLIAERVTYFTASFEILNWLCQRRIQIKVLWRMPRSINKKDMQPEEAGLQWAPFLR
jgi:hypothetical protein